MPSKKVLSADNQQERLKIANWIVGFVDGEGSFLIGVYRNKTASLGWQVFPEFVVTQGKSSVKSLEGINRFFSCGDIYLNKRFDNHREDLYRYCVRKIQDLYNVIVPFFERNQLKTAKRFDFEKFSKVVKMMHKRQHLTKSGLEKIRSISLTMNRKGKSNLQNPQRLYARGKRLFSAKWRGELNVKI